MPNESSRQADATALRAGLALNIAADGTTRWIFASDAAPGVRAGPSRTGTGLWAARSFGEGEVVLVEPWLVGVPLQSSANTCEACLRVCAWTPESYDCPSCSARYCSTGCRAVAWRKHHCLLCVATAANGMTGATKSTHPLEVFAKHARLAPGVLQQKPEDVLLAARMLATIVLHGDGDGKAPDAAAAAAGNVRSAAMVVPPPFDRLESYCVIGAGDPKHRLKWVSESYRLLAASALGKHPAFSARCPPRVYSHCLGLIDRNAASVRSLAASALHVAKAVPGASTKGPGRTAEGIGVYPTLSFVNHSCGPNTVNAKGVRDGDAALDSTLVLRASRLIREGEEVSFDYLDLAHERALAGGARAAGVSPEERRVRLLEHFGFQCACALCRGS